MGKIKEKFIEEQEESRRMDMDFLDYQSRQGRLNKRKAKKKLVKDPRKSDDYFCGPILHILCLSSNSVYF